MFNTDNPIILKNNVWEGDHTFFEKLGWTNGINGNIISSGNVNSSVAPLVFMDKTFPADFDYHKLEYWVGYSERYKMDVYYELGDFVYYQGKLYECIMTGSHTGIEPSLHPEVWKKKGPMTDDFKLDPLSPLKGVGLMDLVVNN